MSGGPLRSPRNHSITDMGVVQTRRLEGEATCEREPTIRSSFVGQLHPNANQSTERLKRGMAEEVEAMHIRLYVYIWSRPAEHGFLSAAGAVQGFAGCGGQMPDRWTVCQIIKY